MPLTQLYPDPNAESTASNIARVDIIAVHGLNPRSKNDRDHAWDTWRTPPGPQGSLWLRDDLPQHVPETRIFLYEYNATAVYGKDRNTFIGEANKLLETIRIERDEMESRPILFFGHSIGGLLIEQALINAYNNPKYTPIKDSTAGLVFFATPQHGGDRMLVSLGDVVAKIATTMGFQKGDDVVETLKKGSIFSDIMQEHWRHQILKYTIISFWGALDKIVPAESARFGLPGGYENIVRLNADHSGVCKFGPSLNDQDNFELVQVNIQDLYEVALRKYRAKGIRANFEKYRNNLAKRLLPRDRPSPEPGDGYNTWVLDIWKSTRKTISSSARPESQGSLTLRSHEASHARESTTEERLGTEGDFDTKHIRTDPDDRDLISLLYDELPKSVAEQRGNYFHVIVRKYKSSSPLWLQQPSPLFRGPILTLVEILLDIPPRFTSLSRGSDAGSCIPFTNDQTHGYVIQTPFYNNFKGFWSLFIKWSHAITEDSEVQYSQILAILEANGDLPQKILIDVNKLSTVYPHPVHLLTRLLEEHIEDSAVAFGDITERIVKIEQKLREDLTHSQDIRDVDKMMLIHQGLHSDLHACSSDVVDLEKRRRFEQNMSSHINQLICSILEGYGNDQQPQPCLDIKQRMDFFSQLAASRDLDIESLPRRISTQMSVLYNQIAQRDALVNLDIAKATREDSVIMIQDSNAMKTIAVLTTLFLPGTFIAAIMSTSMFSFADDEIYLSNKFWIYWALTIPLTIIVVTGLLIWMRATKRKVSQRTQNGAQQGRDIENGLPMSSAHPWQIWRKRKKID